MIRRRMGFTTVEDIEEYKKITWAFLTNITTSVEYDGMAYAFRREGIPLYGYDRGSLKQNHPLTTLGIPRSKDVSYGVDIYVPTSMKKRAEKILADKERLRECAELEAVVGEEERQAFTERAIANKKRHKEERKEARRALSARVSPASPASAPRQGRA